MPSQQVGISDSGPTTYHIRDQEIVLETASCTAQKINIHVLHFLAAFEQLSPLLSCSQYRSFPEYLQNALVR